MVFDTTKLRSIILLCLVSAFTPLLESFAVSKKILSSETTITHAYEDRSNDHPATFIDFRDGSKMDFDAYNEGDVKELISKISIQPKLLATADIEPRAAQKPPWYCIGCLRNHFETIKRLPITLVAFKETFNFERIQDEVDLLNGAFYQCGIQLPSKINVRIFESPEIPLSYFCGSDNYRFPSAGDEQWGLLLREYESEGIPVVYLKRSISGGPLSTGSAQFTLSQERKNNTKPFSWSERWAEAFFPKFTVYLSDYLDPELSNRLDYKKSNLTLSHELGHILFDEGHNDRRKNLMYDFEDEEKKGRGQKITREQCMRARNFLDTYFQK